MTHDRLTMSWNELFMKYWNCVGALVMPMGMMSHSWPSATQRL
jgi:hypothetical protein